MSIFIFSQQQMVEKRFPWLSLSHSVSVENINARTLDTYAPVRTKRAMRNRRGLPQTEYRCGKCFQADCNSRCQHATAKASEREKQPSRRANEANGANRTKRIERWRGGKGGEWIETREANMKQMRSMESHSIRWMRFEGDEPDKDNADIMSKHDIDESNRLPVPIESRFPLRARISLHACVHQDGNFPSNAI